MNKYPVIPTPWGLDSRGRPIASTESVYFLTQIERWQPEGKLGQFSLTAISKEQWDHDILLS